MPRSRTSLRLGAVALLLPALALSSCSSSGGNAASTASNKTTSSGSPATAAAYPVSSQARALLPATFRSAGSLKVATSLDYPPFEFLTKSGEKQGMDIDLIAALAATLGLKTNYVKVPFPGEIAGLAANRFDVAMATFTITPERAAQVNFLRTILTGSIVSVVKGQAKGITGPTMLCGHKVGASQGSAEQPQLATLSKQCTASGKSAINTSFFQTQAATVQALLNGRVDATFLDSTTSGYINENTGNKFTEVGGVYMPLPAGLAVSKSNVQLLKALQSAMQSLITSGAYGRLLAKWDQSKNAVDAATTTITAK